jgi:hypothetical protein
MNLLPGMRRGDGVDLLDDDLLEEFQKIETYRSLATGSRQAGKGGLCEVSR